MAAINSAAVNHPSRDFLLYSAIIGLPLNIIRFIIMVKPSAVFTLILLASSAIFGFTLRRLHRQGAHLQSTFATPITDPLTCLLADILLATLSLITLIFTWIRNGYQAAGESFLVAYSSTPLMFNMFLHFGLALLVLLRTPEIQNIIRELAGDLMPGAHHSCQHCQGRLGSHHEEDEEQPLVSSTDDGEEGIESGTRMNGPPSVWNQV
ncbi:hypothetical protein ACHAPI_004062 [Fusarium lateritium]